MEATKVLLLLGVCLGQILVVSGGKCNRQPPMGTDCSTIDTVCHVKREEGEEVFYDELEQPEEK